MSIEKKYFLDKAEGVQKAIWDAEFKRFKTREIREEIRATYDASKNRLVSLEAEIEKEKAKEKSEILPGMEDQRVILERDTARYLEQMKQLDIEVEGAPQTNENPEGVQGINQYLESLRELHSMVLDYAKDK